ncbi:hypothetical protein BOTCAL_0905g00010 [Botryotinia calthae]|uniref:Nephrocystin 3-like N-terminal domain-containing protein n=1 Tax=Botryotinia calthae TaxID=38488 RepID=A0A4Y8CFE8_9HELO|nr:hypothetical protein BOTCAL_0905g00010 [Botryotinia calthae]
MFLYNIINKINKKKVPTVLLSYFFYQTTDSRINHATTVLRDLIYLLVNQKRSLILYIQKRYNQKPKNSFEALLILFKSILNNLKLQGSIYLIVDVFDKYKTDLPKFRNLSNIKRTFNIAIQKLRLYFELNEKSVFVIITKFIQLKVNQLTMCSKYSNDI